MERNEINDATFDINLNSPKISCFNSENLKECTRKIKELKIRIVKVKLKKWNNRNLTNKLAKRNSNTR